MAQSVAFVVGDQNVLGVSVFQLEIEGIRAPPWGFGRNLCRSINSSEAAVRDKQGWFNDFS